MAQLFLLALIGACTGELPPIGTNGPIDCIGDDCPDGDVIAKPCIGVSTRALPFGEVRLGEEDPVQSVTVTNPCSGALEVSGLDFAEDVAGNRSVFELIDPPDVPFEIDATDEVELRIRVRAERYAPFADSLRITNNDQNFPEELVAVTVQMVCESAALDFDTDRDTIPDGCDICADGPDQFDSDEDGTPNSCDLCDLFDDRIDGDGDGVPDGCDACPDFDDTLDEDDDYLPDDCDRCPLGDNSLDADGDTIPDACDVCAAGDDRDDPDLDGVPTACDVCIGFDDLVDTDGDDVPDGCDVCPGSPDAADADGDTVPDGCDVCVGFDDRSDQDGDTVPDGCDICPAGDDAIDTDLDDVPDACDACEGFDDALDDDMDGRPDACDTCIGGNDAEDDDADGVANFCDACEGFDDGLDADNDFVPDDCDVCPGFDDLADADGDLVPDACDACEGADDALDADGDQVPDACDACPNFDDNIDADGDTVPDLCDACPGEDDRDDLDGDLIPDACDDCPELDDAIDDDLDGVPGGLDGSGVPLPGSCDLCEGFDDSIDADGDSIPDQCDVCPDADDLLDSDQDTVADGCDRCPGFDDFVDSDGDTVADGCDRCTAGDDLVDSDGDRVADACDQCPGFDDGVDADFDDIPDDCDSCVGGVETEVFPPAPANLTDILLVVDDSCSMGPFQTALGNNFNAFISAMAGVGADWRVAVITTSSPQFRGPVITNNPNAAADFAAQVNVGTTGSGFEQGILQAFDATQAGGDAAPGSATGFQRTSAVFSVVFVSDENDQSPITPQQAYDFWVQMKGNDPGKVVINGIVAPPPQDQGYRQLIDLAGGQQFDIVNAQWGANLASIAIGSLATQVYPINQPPVPETLLVRSNGVPIEGWIFDQCQNAILFDGSNRPAAGAFVTVEYIRDCEGVLGGCRDGVDNDGDGLIDFPEEPGCETACDPNEADPPTPPVCANGADDDGDGLSDYPADPECGGASYRYETCDEVDFDVFGYRMCEDTDATSVCPDLSNGTALPLGDEGAQLVPLGFTFDFYGIEYNQVYVGANGTLNFEAPLSPFNNLCLPTGGADRSIMVWWDDLNPAAGGVWARTSGAAPNRRFEVQWKTPHFMGGPIDVRAVLTEGSNDIDLCYVDTISGLGVSNGESATAGIQGNQSVFLEYSCFSGRLTQDKVLRFLHP
ncbi:MAG: hypothetical protein AAF211_03835 [Myxococcota bacterium]